MMTTLAAPLNTVSVPAAGPPVRSAELRVVVPRRRRDSKRSALIQVAREEIAANGFAATHLNVVAARVGIRKSTLFHYFTDKEALHRAAVQEPLDELAAAVDAVAAATGTFAARLDQLVECLHHHFAIEPLLARLLLRGFVDLPAPDNNPRPAAIDRVLMRLAETVALGVVEARVPATGAGAAALSILSLVCMGHVPSSVPFIAHGEGPMGATQHQELAELRMTVRRFLDVTN